MCGIIGYAGCQQAYPILVKGLERLEYRGYDSAGIGILNTHLQTFRKKGRVSELASWVHNIRPLGSTGVGHTRWATHGEPSDRNSHPHCSADGRLALVHNGIIENWAELKQELTDKGHSFSSETDTEVLVHLVDEVQRQEGSALEEAIGTALQRVVGSYVILLIDANHPGTIYAAKKGGSLLIGVGSDEHYIASDAAAFIEYTSQVIVLDEDEMAIVRPDQVILKSFANEQRHPDVERLDMDLAAIERTGYPHYMIKEISEQPKTTRDCLRGRLNLNAGSITLGGLHEHIEALCLAKRIILIGCGTSRNAGLVAEYMIEQLCHIAVEVEYASEFRYRSPVIGQGDVIIAISQSGETADTLVAIQMAEEQGALVLGVCNVVGSSIARNSHAGIYTHAGHEIAVASTKAFTAQLTVLFLLALRIAHVRKTIDEKRYLQLLTELDAIPEKIETVLQTSDSVRRIAEKYSEARCAMFLGRGANYPIALEGALKLMEVAYIPAEGYPAAEMKHGPIAMVDESLAIICVATRDHTSEKMLSSIQEVKARGGRVIAVISENDSAMAAVADYQIAIPNTDPLLSPILAVVPLQLFAYHLAVVKGHDVDKPRNLAKSVTVE